MAKKNYFFYNYPKPETGGVVHVNKIFFVFELHILHFVFYIVTIVVQQNVSEGICIFIVPS